MQFGVYLPQAGFGTEPDATRRVARTVEELEYGYLLAADHVLGVSADRPEFDGVYDHRDPFHEPLTLFAHLAGPTDDLRFVTGVLVLPQRQTALVAKQAAEVDRLSDGRLTLGVAVGWNRFESEALGQDFRTRGRRIEEQIEVLRRLWSGDPVDYDGAFHRLPDVGLNPPPVQQPVPIWMGGDAAPVLRRVARLADGWMARRGPVAEVAEHLSTLREYTAEAGRDADALTIHTHLTLGSDTRFDRPTATPADWVDRAHEFADLGATHLLVDATRMEHANAAAFLETLTDFRDAVGDSALTWDAP